ncbi:MAG: hypothetical protein HRT35_30815 [Algicola sp.]|nr:hypothetical protein [Algicola sp.]
MLSPLKGWLSQTFIDLWINADIGNEFNSIVIIDAVGSIWCHGLYIALAG